MNAPAEIAAARDRASAFLAESGAARRIWERDHTLWRDDPTEIADRLGWLDLPERMADSVPDLAAFADEIRGEGIAHVVLLGMGGSALGPETVRQCLPKRDGFPELITLDSTLPDAVKAVADSIDASRALFIISSKSGTTIEPNVLYRFFRKLADDALGEARAGSRFIAITDADTPLDHLARADGFRRVFRNPADIGGRYSVLSYFGLVPTALTGRDARGLLRGGAMMRELCNPNAAANPAAAFGADMGALALAGRDKLTILASPPLAPFGLWAEQLIAESLGKDGRGVIPIAGEPLADADAYGDDRHFVHMNRRGDDSAAAALADALESSGRHPLTRFEMDGDNLAAGLGAEFYRWEFATAIAGAAMGVNPFDQPDVQSAKDLAQAALDARARGGRLPNLSPAGSARELADALAPGDYIAILAYIPQTERTDAALAALRAALLSKHGVPTTLGYGPRYLHSTGQLHKGGANNIAALALVSPHQAAVPIPGERIDFGALADAQAWSDMEALRTAGRRTAVTVLNPANRAEAVREIAGLV